VVRRDLGPHEREYLPEIRSLFRQPPLQGPRRGGQQYSDPVERYIAACELGGDQVFHLATQVVRPIGLLSSQMIFKKDHGLSVFAR
jgi:hypothetical protein